MDGKVNYKAEWPYKLFRKLNKKNNPDYEEESVEGIRNLKPFNRIEKIQSLIKNKIL